jgi:hypothetical protein
MARMYQLLMDKAPSEIAVFRTAQEARRWLGLAETDPDLFNRK